MQQGRLTDEGKAVAAYGTIASDEPVVMGSDRGFGLVFTLVFLVVSLFPLLRGESPRWWSLAGAGVLLVVTLVKAEWLTPLNRVWFRFGPAPAPPRQPDHPGGDLLRRGDANRPPHARLGQGPVTPAFRPERRELLAIPGPTGAGTRINEKPVLRWAMSFLREFWLFLRVRKKYWLLPVIVTLLVLGGLLALSQSSAVAPMIYTIF